jgi:NTE family protein
MNRTISVTGDDDKAPEVGMALCLSGGGYRAMLFHLGAIWRLHETGILRQLDRISSVSGGSITAAMVGLKWAAIQKDNGRKNGFFIEEVVKPLRSLAAQTIDIKSVLLGFFMPGGVGAQVVRAYEKALFQSATLQDLPDKPRFVINSTNIQSGALWRFEKPYMRDYRIGEVRNPDVHLAVAVAASSAFPPFLSPLTLKVCPQAFTQNSGNDLQCEPYTSRVVLSDGGVYDNLGLETAWKRYQTILVSDGGGKITAEPKPWRNWMFHSYRVLNIIDNQVRSLRKRQLIDSFASGLRRGAYWGIRTNIADYKLLSSLPCPFANSLALASVPTRLKSLNECLQEKLINWGYAVADAGLRTHLGDVSLPPQFPYPQSGI